MSLVMQDCRDAQSRDGKEFAAFFNEGNVQVRSHCASLMIQSVLQRILSCHGTFTLPKGCVSGVALVFPGQQVCGRNQE